MFLTIFSIFTIIKSISAEFVSCDELLLGIKTNPTQRLMGGWNAGYDAPMDTVKAILKYPLPALRLKKYGVSGKSFTVTQTWKQAVQGTKVMVSLKFDSLDAPVCLLYKKISTKLNLVIKMRKSHAINTPKANDVQYQQVSCAEEYIGVSQFSNINAVGSWKQKTSMMYKTIARKAINQDITDIEAKTYKFDGKYKIVDLWFKVVSGSQILAELETKESPKHICVLIYTQPWTNTNDLVKVSIAKPVTINAPEPIAVQYQQVSCAEQYIGVSQFSDINAVGAWKQRNSNEYKIAARDAIHQEFSDIEAKTYKFDEKKYKIVDLWLKMVAGTQMLAELQTAESPKHICVMIYQQQWTNTLTLMEATIAKPINAPQAPISNNQLVCSQKLINVNRQTYQPMPGAWMPNDDASAKNTAGLVITMNKQQIEKLTYNFDKFAIVDLWTQVVNGENMLAELKVNGKNEHICVMMYYNPVDYTSNVEKAVIA